MSAGVRSLTTSGLAPKQRIAYWTHALAELCGQFDIDPLDAPSLDGQIDCATISRLKLCRIEVSRHRVALPSARHRAGEHPFIKILFQTHGTSRFEQQGQRIDLGPGDCLAYDVSAPHSIVSESLTRHDVVIVPEALLQERGFHPGRMIACKLSARSGAARIARDVVHSAIGEASTLTASTAPGVADTLLDLLLVPFRQIANAADRSGPAALHLRAQAFIHEHLRDPDLSIDRISAALGCTKRYLHMVFSERGTTISDYIWQMRLRNCHQELTAYRGATVTDVAFAWGFSSSSHFSRLFKKHFGVAPSAVCRTPIALKS